MKERKFDYAKCFDGVSLCPPAVRMVAVEVFYNDIGDEPGDPFGVQFFPVLAIQAAVARDYIRFRREESTTFARANDLVEAGWDPSGTQIDYDVIVATDDYGIATLKDIECSNSMTEYFVCPWPPEEDERRLATQIEKLRSSLKRVMDHRKPTAEPLNP